MTKLSEADTDKIINYLKEKWKGRPCPMCQSAGWAIQDKSFIDSCGWKDLGMVFLGIALATFVSLWLPGNPVSNTKVAWAIIGVSVLLWLCFIFFQYQLDKRDNEKNTITANGILVIMQMI